RTHPGQCSPPPECQQTHPPSRCRSLPPAPRQGSWSWDLDQAQDTHAPTRPWRRLWPGLWPWPYTTSPWLTSSRSNETGSSRQPGTNGNGCAATCTTVWVPRSPECDTLSTHSKTPSPPGTRYGPHTSPPYSVT